MRLGPSEKKVLERRQDRDKQPTVVAIGMPPNIARETIRFEARLAESRRAAGLQEARVVGSEKLVYLPQDAIVSDADVPMSTSVAIGGDYTRAEAGRLANGIGIR